MKVEPHAFKPDHKKAIAEKDPLEDISVAMAERGFGSLWSDGSVNPNKFDDVLKKEFLRTYATTGRWAFSAASCDISRSLASRTKRDDPVFAAACEEAREYFRDILHAELFRRGVSGFKREVVGGRNRNEIIEIVDYSDRAMELLSRIHMPEMQKQQQVAVVTNVTNAGGVAPSAFDIESMPAADLSMLKTLLQNQAKRQADLLDSKAADVEAIPSTATEVVRHAK